MNCAELQDLLPEIIDGSKTQEQQAHLRTCPECASLVSDLNTISQMSEMLREADEPSPRIWNSIEIALRQEGLIRESQPEPFVVPSPRRRLSWAWLVPVAAAVAIMSGLVTYQVRVHNTQLAVQPTDAPVASQVATYADVSAEDQQLLAAVGTEDVSMRDSYRTDLQHVNEYIRDAEQSLKNNPDDEEAQQSVLAAYEQKAMVYQLALARSEP